VSATFQSVPGPPLNQTDLRFASIFNYGRYRLQGMIDIYNVFNSSTVLAYNTTFGQEWLRPTDVLQGRLVKIGGQADVLVVGVS
jgi:hypothetical protein